MDSFTKQFLKGVLKNYATMAAASAATWMLAHGMLTSDQQGAFEQIFVGAVMGVIALLVGWYREHGHALVHHELANLRLVKEQN